MFYVIDLTTGEVLAEGQSAHINGILENLMATVPLDNMWVKADCESGYGLAAADWLGVA